MPEVSYNDALYVAVVLQFLIMAITTLLWVRAREIAHQHLQRIGQYRAELHILKQDSQRDSMLLVQALTRNQLNIRQAHLLQTIINEAPITPTNDAILAHLNAILQNCVTGYDEDGWTGALTHLHEGHQVKWPKVIEDSSYTVTELKDPAPDPSIAKPA